MFGHYNPKDVFISYCSANEADARWVKAVLEANGVSCWMAPESIPGGSSYPEQIPIAIEHCKVLVLVFSQKTNSSIWVPKEMLQALNCGKLVMPFMLEDCALGKDFAFPLTNVQRYPAYTDRQAVTEQMVREILVHLARSKKILIPAMPNPAKPVIAPVQQPVIQQPAKQQPVKQKPVQSVKAAPQNGAWQNNWLMASVLGKGMRSAWGDEEFLKLRISRKDVGTVTFLDTTKAAPADAVDVSGRRNRTVLAWAQKNDSLYDVTIAGDGGISGAGGCRNLFAGCSNLRRIDFNGCFHTDDAKAMTFMFYECMALRELDVSSFVTTNVTSFDRMFNGCMMLTELDISNFDTRSAQGMGHMFHNCVRLRKLDVSRFDTSKVMTMAGMFHGCRTLTELDVSSFDTLGVDDFSKMFYGCKFLTEIDITNFRFSKNADVSGMFDEIGKLFRLRCDVTAFSSTMPHDRFMTYGAAVAGRPWEELFGETVG